MEFYIGLQSNTISSSFDAMDNQLKRERERESSTRSNRFFLSFNFTIVHYQKIYHYYDDYDENELDSSLNNFIVFFFFKKNPIQFVSFHQQLSSTDERRSYFWIFFPYVFWNFVWWNKNQMTLSCFLWYVWKQKSSSLPAYNLINQIDNYQIFGY